MKKSIKRVFYVNLIACVLLFNICYVSAYNFVEDDNEEPVYRDRLAIYDLVDLYYDIVGAPSSEYDHDGNIPGGIINLHNYEGACNFINVKGVGTFSLEDYVAGVLKHEHRDERDKPEYMKALAIAARSYVLAKFGSSCSIENSTNEQTFSKVDPNDPNDIPLIKAANDTAGQVIMRNGKIAVTHYQSMPPESKQKNVENGPWTVTFQKFSDDPSTEWVWHTNLSRKEAQKYVNYFGGAASETSKNNWGMSQNIAAYLAAKESYTTEMLLNLFYGTDQTSYEKLKDGDYVGASEFKDSEFGNIRYWNQGDYSAYYYSADVSKQAYTGSKGNAATISSHGCGPTSMAIVLSSFENRDISPIQVTEELCNAGGCTGDGSIYSVMATVLNSHGYKTQFVDKTGDVSKVIHALETKNSLVIALMGPGTFTKGGHYIVLTGTNTSGQVSVADPASRDRTNTKWFPFNQVVEESKGSGFLIVTR